MTQIPATPNNTITPGRLYALEYTNPGQINRRIFLVTSRDSGIFYKDESSIHVTNSTFPFLVDDVGLLRRGWRRIA